MVPTIPCPCALLLVLWSTELFRMRKEIIDYGLICAYLSRLLTPKEVIKLRVVASAYNSSTGKQRQANCPGAVWCLIWSFQLNWIWKQQRGLWACLWGWSQRINWGARPSVRVERTFQWQPRYWEEERKNCLAFACPISSLAGNAIYSVAVTILHWEQNPVSTAFQHGWTSTACPEILRDFITRVYCSQTQQLPSSQLSTINGYFWTAWPMSCKPG